MAKPYYATGHRKTATARVFLKLGRGNITINHQSLEDYFVRETSRIIVCQPLELLGVKNQFDAFVTVKGGGSSGQAGAARLGIARVLIKYYQANADTEMEHIPSYRVQLRSAGLISRDSREVERKKVGRHKARKSTQYSKR